ncbi:hypothetical protein MCEZEM1_03506 [Comamonadaceae bacterium]
MPMASMTSTFCRWLLSSRWDCMLYFCASSKAALASFWFNQVIATSTSAPASVNAAASVEKDAMIKRYSGAQGASNTAINPGPVSV